jgi:hypothetical protein
MLQHTCEKRNSQLSVLRIRDEKVNEEIREQTTGQISNLQERGARQGVIFLAFARSHYLVRLV